MDITVIGPDPAMKGRKGGIAKLVTYQMKMNSHTELNFKFIYLDWKKFENSLLSLRRLIGVAKALFNIFFKKEESDYVHLHVSLNNRGAIKNLLLAYAAKHKWNKLLIQIHGGRFDHLNGFSKKVWKRTFQKADKVGVFPGPQFKELREEVQSEKLVKMANFIPYDISIQKRKSDYKNPCFLFLGRVVKEKGVLFLIKSFLELRSEGINAELTIAGSGNELDQVKKIAMDSDFQEDVAIPGYVSGGELRKIMDKCNIFVLPSLHEGFPLSFLECSLKGMLPIITTNNGLPYFFGENKEYLKVDLAKRGDLRKKMKKAAIDEELRYEIGSNVQEKVRKNFTIDTYSDTLYQIYNGLSK